MDAKRLAEIAERCEQATAGPWRERYEYKHDPPGSLIAATARGHQVVTDAPGGVHPAANLTFIAHAREDVPDLLAHIAALEAMQDEVLALEGIEPPQGEENLASVVLDAMEDLREKIAALKKAGEGMARVLSGEAGGGRWRDDVPWIWSRIHAE